MKNDRADEPTITIYPDVDVNYNDPVENQAKARNYSRHPGIKESDLPTKLAGLTQVDLALINFNKCIGSKSVVKEMKRLGYRPGEVKECVALDMKEPDLKRQFTIVALGSTLLYSGSTLTPCLRDRDGRVVLSFHLDWMSTAGWLKCCRFLAVRLLNSKVKNESGKK